MAKICYTPKRFRESSRAKIEWANSIIEEYLAKGFSLTLRQLFYQFVSRDLIPNSQREYSNLGNLISDARLAGLVDWDAIEDRRRGLRGAGTPQRPHWNSPTEIIDACVYGYRRDKWATQPQRIEVWVEKESLIEIVQHACDPLDVPYYACLGYNSQTGMWVGAQRLIRHLRRGQTPTIIHLGDHDPSGIDMTRDTVDRLTLFLTHHGHNPPRVFRAGLNMDQVEEYNPPPNPAKVTDSRFAEYVALYGEECWELDALPPDVLSGIIQEEILRRMDQANFDKVRAREEREKRDLVGIQRNWEEVSELVRELDMEDADDEEDDEY